MQDIYTQQNAKIPFTFVLGEGFMQGLAKRKETAKERIRSKVKEPMFLFVSPSLSIIHLLNPSSNLWPKHSIEIYRDQNHTEWTNRLEYESESQSPIVVIRIHEGHYEI